MARKIKLEQKALEIGQLADGPCAHVQEAKPVAINAKTFVDFYIPAEHDQLGIRFHVRKNGELEIRAVTGVLRISPVAPNTISIRVEKK